MLKLFVIGLSFWLALVSTFLHIDVLVSRITKAIRKDDLQWTVYYFELGFYWVLFLISCLI